ncbi:MAG TPA: hypothetical protein VI698_00245 [Nitrososphaerales archaeon]|nr:hypothetical protein [Nitrososphaerales archaeon]
MPDLIKRYKRIHPGCTKKDIEDLVNAIKEGKYWNALPNYKDALYVIALTRARIKVNKANVVKVTHFGKILVDQSIAKFCSRSKVLLVMKDNSHYRARYVITWPAFLNIMRSDSESFYNALISSDTKELIGVKQAKTMMTLKH